MTFSIFEFTIYLTYDFMHSKFFRTSLRARAGKFQFNPEAKQHLLSLNVSIPVGVVSVLGKYRTGKLFPLNNVIINSGEEVFKVGPTVNSCTKGIWLAKELVKPANSSSTQILLLDV